MEEISLEKSSQKKFKKNVNKLKRDIKDGEITVQETRPKRGKSKIQADRGIIYLGHIPHGFYEQEMREFFAQFGIVTRVKLCRSAKSGRSKGYGYVEFLHTEVAKIAAETMNNYLMFKRRLVAEYVPPEKQKKILMSKTIDLRNLPAVRRRNKELRKKNQNVSSEKYMLQCKKEVKSLQSKLEKLKELGINHTVKPVNAPEETIVALVGSSAKEQEKKVEKPPQKSKAATEIAVSQKKRKGKTVETEPQKKTKKSKANVVADKKVQSKVEKTTQTPEKKKKTANVTLKKVKDAPKNKLSKKRQGSFEKKVLRRKSVTLK